MTPSYKIPVSVLVVLHDGAGDILLLERADRAGYWQSVTGSLDHATEPTILAACREVKEETGIDRPQSAFVDTQFHTRYVIYPHWRHRYAPGVTENTEHVFTLLIPRHEEIVLSPREHSRYRWLPADAAADACFSPSNAQAIRALYPKI